MAKNINNILAQYAEMGINLDDIEAVQFEDEPGLEINNPVLLQLQKEMPGNANAVEQKNYAQQQKLPPRPQTQTTKAFNQNNQGPQVQKVDSTFHQNSNNQQTAQQSGASFQLPGDRNSAQNEIVGRSAFQSISQLQNLDLSTFIKLFQQFLQMHKQYQNYVKYLSDNLRQNNEAIISDKIKLIEQCHVIRNEIMAGKFTVNLYDFTCRFMHPIEFEQFHGRTKIQYDAYLSNMISDFEKQLETENLFLDILKNKQVTIVRKTQAKKQGEKLTYENIKYEVLVLQEEIKYLKSLVGQDWTPLPIVYKEEETRDIQSENRDIAKNTLKIKIKRVLMGPQLYYEASIFVNDLGNSFQTPNSDKQGIFNYCADVNLSKESIKEIHKRSIEVRVFYHYKLFFKSELCVSTIRLDDLFWSSTFDGMIPISIQEYPECKLEFSVSLKEPVAKTIGQNQVVVQHLGKKFCALDLNCGVVEYEGMHLPEVIRIFERKKAEVSRMQRMMDEQEVSEVEKQLEELMISKREQKQQQQQQLNKQEVVVKQQLNKDEVVKVEELSILIHGANSGDEKVIRENESVLPAGLMMSDVLYPEDPTKAPVYQFVENYQKVVESQMSTLKPDQRRYVQKTQIQDFMKMKIVFNHMIFLKKLDQIASKGDFDTYKNMITGLEAREDKLITFYRKLGLLQWQKLVCYRKALLLEELNQMNQQP